MTIFETILDWSIICILVAMQIYAIRFIVEKRDGKMRFRTRK